MQRSGAKRVVAFVELVLVQAIVQKARRSQQVCLRPSHAMTVPVGANYCPLQYQFGSPWTCRVRRCNFADATLLQCVQEAQAGQGDYWEFMPGENYNSFCKGTLVTAVMGKSNENVNLGCAPSGSARNEIPPHVRRASTLHDRCHQIRGCRMYGVLAPFQPGPWSWGSAETQSTRGQ